MTDYECRWRRGDKLQSLVVRTTSRRRARRLVWRSLPESIRPDFAKIDCGIVGHGRQGRAGECFRLREVARGWYWRRCSDYVGVALP